MIAAIGVVVYVTILFAVSTLAAARGGAHERQAVVICILGFVAYEITAAAGETYSVLGWRTMIVDVLMLAAFFLIALKSDRFWPLWVAAFQLVALATHLSKLLEPSMVRTVYAYLQQFWSFPVIVTIGVGAYRTWRVYPPAFPSSAAISP